MLHQRKIKKKTCKIFYELNSINCIQYIVFYALYSMYCIICIVCYTLYSIYCMHCMLCIVFYALYSMLFTLCIVRYALYSMHCVLLNFETRCRPTDQQQNHQASNDLTQAFITSPNLAQPLLIY
jgi:hypothetical protein